MFVTAEFAGIILQQNVITGSVPLCDDLTQLGQVTVILLLVISEQFVVLNDAWENPRKP